ncbi:MAG TPA: DUF1631 family protein [Ramlibacter sp.]|nr:DUF1631 family protein [Ramlibacter sp.]
MAKLFKLRPGISDDPTAFQPTLNDCLSAMLEQSHALIGGVVDGLVLGCAATGPRRSPALQPTAVRSAVDVLRRDQADFAARFQSELSRLFYEGGGKEQTHTEALRFEDLQLFGEAELGQSIEVARGRQEVSHSVDDVLPELDALVSTLLGWRSSQPGLNPMRPDVFVRALQSALAELAPDAHVREVLIAPASGLLGANLRKLYREMADWLASTGVEPAVPLGGRRDKGSAAGSGSPVTRSVARTLLTLDKLRKLLAGDFDPEQGQRAEFLHTVPASMAMLQDMNQVDQLVRKLEEKRSSARVRSAAEVADNPKLGLQLGEQVVRLMFENLAQDGRLVGAYKQQLRAIEPAVLQLAQQDSRFFSDRNHPARQVLERMTQRSLAFKAESDEGWHRFLGSIEGAVQWLDAKPVEADTFRELLGQLQDQWNVQDYALRQRREEAARALVQAEQRNLLAQRLSGNLERRLEGSVVPEFVSDFLKTSWTQVLAQAKLSCFDGSDDPYDYMALVDDLAWSVQKNKSQRGRLQRLATMIPGLLSRMREGLERIDYPPELTQRFFDRLAAIHESALKEGRDSAARAAAEDAETAPSEFGPSAFEDSAVWLASQEASDAGYIGPDSFPPDDAADLPPPADVRQDEAAESLDASAEGELPIGTWVELQVQGQSLRVQLTWASPHQTLFMFSSPTGTAHSMSRRTLDRLRAQGRMQVLAGRNLVEEALDEVAKAALLNSLGGKS